MQKMSWQLLVYRWDVIKMKALHFIIWLLLLQKTRRLVGNKQHESANKHEHGTTEKGEATAAPQSFQRSVAAV